MPRSDCRARHNSQLNVRTFNTLNVRHLIGRRSRPHSTPRRRAMSNVDTTHFDLVVIGFGRGGKALAAAMGRSGKRVAVIERSAEMYGGTCPNVGCVPTKSLIHHAETGAGHGEAVEKTRNLTTKLRGVNFVTLDSIDSVSVLTGRAAFVDAKTVEVSAGDDRLTVTGDTIVINTGAEPVVPDIPGLAGSSRVHTSTDLIGRENLPRRLAVLGGGHVGIEFASMFAQFGSEVTVLDRAPRILGREDDDVAASAHQVLADAGVQFVLGAQVIRMTETAAGARVDYRCGDGEDSIVVDAVLVAAGRKPATEGLHLDRAGVATTAAGAVVVDDRLRTSQPHIFAVGDVKGGPQFTYVSLDDSRIVADQLTGRGIRSTADRVHLPYALFLTPPLARVGLTERDAREQGYAVKVSQKAVADIVAMPKAKILGETRGMMKFVIDAETDQVLGAALLSVDAQELINTVTLAMRHGVTAADLRDAIYTHPSSTEAFNEVLSVSRS
ncbi:FAD-dependent oxidoreductase [Amycolatopsis sp. NPDC023774]|uniref:FAD-dependent oxidoreductase n=1 Tax=Amycolatopsis sp. NPDC023774 TaxID=3155015 RepID=UPI0034057D96